MWLRASSQSPRPPFILALVQPRPSCVHIAGERALSTSPQSSHENSWCICPCCVAPVSVGSQGFWATHAPVPAGSPRVSVLPGLQVPGRLLALQGLCSGRASSGHH